MTSLKETNSLVINNLDKLNNTFLAELCDSRHFNQVKFDYFTNCIYNLQMEVLNENDRLNLSIKLWELAFHIQESFLSHQNPEDLFKIDNLDTEEISKINKVLFYLCNWFSYNKKMDKTALLIEGWS